MAIGGSNAPSGENGDIAWLQQYDGTNAILKDKKGKDVSVKVGEYVYNDYGNLKITGQAQIDNYSIITPTQVVNSDYDISKGGRKLVVLNDGRLVCVARATTNTQAYISDDNGVTWTKFYETPYNVGDRGIALATNGIDIYILCFTLGNINSGKFDTMFFRVLVDGDNSGVHWSIPEPQGVQTEGQAGSLVIDTDGNLHACWTSKNSSYPNSFNIRYSKSTDDGVSWGSVDQVTAFNDTRYNTYTPIVIIDNSGNPAIIFEDKSIDVYSIRCKTYEGTAWSNVVHGYLIYDGSTYTQECPTAIVDSDGVIHVSWQGKDSTHNIYDNIRYSKSTDNGVNWSSMSKLTSSDTFNQIRPSIGVNDTNNVFIACESKDDAVFKINLLTYTDNWRSEFLDSSLNAYPSICSNYLFYTKPLLIASESGVDIKFYGDWSIDRTPTQIIPVTTEASSNTELQATISGTLELESPIIDTVYEGFKSKEDLWDADMIDNRGGYAVDKYIPICNVEPQANPYISPRLSQWGSNGYKVPFDYDVNTSQYFVGAGRLMVYDSAFSLITQASTTSTIYVTEVYKDYVYFSIGNILYKSNLDLTSIVGSSATAPFPNFATYGDFVYAYENSTKTVHKFNALTSGMQRLSSIILAHSSGIRGFALNEEVFYLTTTTGDILTFDMEGTLLNTFTYEVGVSPERMKVSGDFIYVADALNMYKINKVTGLNEWKVTTPGTGYISDMEIEDGYIYCGCSAVTKDFLVLDTKDGSPLLVETLRGYYTGKGIPYIRLRDNKLFYTTWTYHDSYGDYTSIGQKPYRYQIKR